MQAAVNREKEPYRPGWCLLTGLLLTASSAVFVTALVCGRWDIIAFYLACAAGVFLWAQITLKMASRC